MASGDDRSPQNDLLCHSHNIPIALPEEEASAALNLYNRDALLARAAEPEIDAGALNAPEFKCDVLNALLVAAAMGVRA